MNKVIRFAPWAINVTAIIALLLASRAKNPNTQGAEFMLAFLILIGCILAWMLYIIYDKLDDIYRRIGNIKCNYPTHRTGGIDEYITKIDDRQREVMFDAWKEKYDKEIKKCYCQIPVPSPTDKNTCFNCKGKIYKNYFNQTRWE